MSIYERILIKIGHIITVPATNKVIRFTYFVTNEVDVQTCNLH